MKRLIIFLVTLLMMIFVGVIANAQEKERNVIIAIFPSEGAIYQVTYALYQNSKSDVIVKEDKIISDEADIFQINMKNNKYVYIFVMVLYDSDPGAFVKIVIWDHTIDNKTTAWSEYDFAMEYNINDNF